MRPSHPITKQILEILIYDPSKIRKFIGLTEDKNYTYRLFKSLFPYRIGIEIDVLHLNREIRKKLVNADNNTAIHFEAQGSSSKENIEIKFSLTTFKSLHSFKKILIMLQESDCKLALNGGLHIHIDLDMHRERAKVNNVVDYVSKYFKYFRNKVFKYPHPPENYGIEGVAYMDAAKISVCRNLPTIEYRMGTPTFNYSKIMKWVLCCQQMNKAVRNKTEFNKELTDLILTV